MNGAKRNEINKKRDLTHLADVSKENLHSILFNLHEIIKLHVDKLTNSYNKLVVKNICEERKGTRLTVYKNYRKTK